MFRRYAGLGFVTALALACGAAATFGHTRDASASVSIAVAFEALVSDADAVAVVTPVEAGRADVALLIDAYRRASERLR